MFGLFAGLLLYFSLVRLGRRLAPYAADLLYHALLLGALAAFMLIFPERYSVGLLNSLISGLDNRDYGELFLIASLAIPIAVILWEEGVKFTLLLYFYRSERGRPPGLFCLVGLVLGLGFASAENLWYTVSYGFASIYWRLLSSSVVHLVLGALVALKISQQKKKLAFATALLWHGSYNMLLEQDSSPWAAVLLLLLLLYTGWQLWCGLSRFSAL